MATQVRCPTCNATVEWSAASRWRPFCSARCKQVDLGAWASDAYPVPGQPQQDEAGREVDDEPG